MKPAKAALVFSLGLFALAAQTLLFRDFLTAFEGNEIALGAFFASWFLWIAAGAFAARLAGRRLSIAPTALLYLPAFVLEHYLILNIRNIAGVPAYELFPLFRLLAFSTLSNAPVSILTGLLFPIACAWVREDSGPGVSIGRVYAAETLGAACGGVLVTLAPHFGYASGSQFLFASLPLCLAAAWARVDERGGNRCGGCNAPTGAAQWRYLVYFAIPLAVLAAFAGGVGERWGALDARRVWQRLMPAESYQGRFLTVNGEYLYGERDGQFVAVASGKPCETLPGEVYGAEVAALCLAQQPDAKRVLIAGVNGLALGRQFLKLPQIERVVWVHPDPEYAATLFSALPEEFKTALSRIEIGCADARAYIRGESQAFDLIVLNPGDAATLVSNRYYTSECLEEARRALRPDGVAALRFQGPANVVGPELALLGASIVKAFQSVFAYTALNPGESSWMIGSERRELSESPATLRDRFAAIPGSRQIASPEALWTLYPPDRIAAQHRAYAQVLETMPAALLRNTDAQPRALLHSLLLTLRQSGFTGSVAIARILAAIGLIFALLIIFAYGTLRAVYLRRTRRVGEISSYFDAGALIFWTGFAGMAVSILLLFAYQTVYGALYTRIGLLSALFMFGAFTGSVCMQRILYEKPQEPRTLLPSLLVLHATLLGLVYLRHATATHAEFVAFFFAAGAFTGFYFPLAAHRARERGDLGAGAAFESLDHTGAALGAAITGILLLPLLGTRATSCILVATLAANVSALFRGGQPANEGDLFDRWRRAAGYAVFGICSLLWAGSILVAVSMPDSLAEEFRGVARAVSGGVELTPESLETPGSHSVTYYVFQSEEGPCSIFNSLDLAPEVNGFGGPVALAITTDDSGTLLDASIIRSRETPAYLNTVLPWLRGLAGRNIYADGAFEDVDAVSGATVTSRALLNILVQSGSALAPGVAGHSRIDQTLARRDRVPDFDLLLLAAFMSGAILLRFRPGRWRRRMYLLASLIVLGFWRNLQYSAHHVVSLPDIVSLTPQWTAAFFLVMLVPAITLLVGNVYCGYVCPFGAAQELLGDLRPARLAADPGKRVWRYGRVVKYVLLALIVIRFAFTRDAAFLSADPLTTFFGALRDRETLALVTVLLVLSIPYRRFWCRNLCPAGAFLALLNHVRLLRAGSPPVQPRNCDLGVRNAEELDCIRCDRCAYVKK